MAAENNEQGDQEDQELLGKYCSLPVWNHFYVV